MTKNGARETATFVPYFWEAYSEIVRPDKFDWYLITRWLPDLGAEAFTVIKVLRAECYFNPREGVLRDECQFTVDELSEKTGITRSALYRLLSGNGALTAFVQKLPEVLHVEGRTRRLPPRWRVCMDTPIHPEDMERYDLLRTRKEHDRLDPASQTEAEKRKSQIEIYEKRKSQIGISGGRKSQTEERKSQNDGRKSQSGILLRNSLPSGGFTKDSLRGLAAVDAPPIDSPQGEGAPAVPPSEQRPEPFVSEPVAGVAASDDPVAAVWEAVLDTLTAQPERVNKPTLETHFRPARLVALSTIGDVNGNWQAVLEARSHFSREWLEGRHREGILSVLTEVTGLPVTALRITGPAK